MIKRILILPILVIFLLLLQIQCNIIDFGSGTVYVTATFDQDFFVNSSSTSYSETESVNLADVYDDAGINPADVGAVNLVEFEIEVLRNGTGSSTTASGSVLFKESGSPLSATLLAGFTDINLNSVLNNPISPFNYPGLMNTSGVAAFKTLVTQMPPPSIDFNLSGTVNSPPVDFDARIRIVLQVRVED